MNVGSVEYTVHTDARMEADGFPGMKVYEHDMTALVARKATSGRHVRPSCPDGLYSTNLFSSNER